jgi:hypothetical protein
MVLFDFNREPEISWFHDGEEDIWIIDYFPFRLVRIHSRAERCLSPPTPLLSAAELPAKSSG